MTEPSDYRALAARLSEERARLERARGDYNVILRSRFHALRMLWFSFKQLLGRSTSRDVYAAWSPAVTVHPPKGQHTSVVGEAALPAHNDLIHAWNNRIERRAEQPPLVTVVIPVFNYRDVTVRCLQSIATTWFDSLAVEFIVVDDASIDNTAAVITRLSGVEYVRSGKNEGFVHSCNRGAMLARGKYICFLNNDTVVTGGWLDHLVNTAEGDESIGIVGSKLIYPDGRLQEAGGVIWRDATGWNVGRNENPADPRYNYVRDVDYVSGAALLVRRDLFFKAGGFSDLFRPAYYEDVDLCFQVRSLGSRVVYQPRSVVVHYESVTSGNARTGTKRFQEINRPKFKEKWAEQLDGHFDNNRDNVSAAALPNKRARTVLFVDSYVPSHDREAGSRRMFHIVKMLRASGYNVVFLPDNFAPIQPYTEQLQQLGIQVLYHVDGGPTLEQALEQVLPIIDVAWISRPELYKKYAPLVRRKHGIRVIYDTVDLHHVRKQRETELTGSSDDTEWREWQRIEVEAARSASSTVVVTPEEKAKLAELGIADVFVVPTIHEPVKTPLRRFEDTAGLLFVGNYNHPPNMDAAQWLCSQVMPIVWEALPDVKVTLAGSNPNEILRELASKRVSVTGYVSDLTPYFRRNRLFVAPLRYGAGMKGKVGQALEHALPIVTTPIGAEGFGLRNNENAVIAPAEPKQFADAVIALYGDCQRWQAISSESARTLEAFTPSAVMPELGAILT